MIQHLKLIKVNDKMFIKRQQLTYHYYNKLKINIMLQLHD